MLLEIKYELHGGGGSVWEHHQQRGLLQGQGRTMRKRVSAHGVLQLYHESEQAHPGCCWPCFLPCGQPSLVSMSIYLAIVYMLALELKLER